MRADEFKPRAERKEKIGPRAGLIPYFKSTKGLMVYLMKPSDVKYGGPKKQIAKGGIDDGETPLAAAMREAKEELGLRANNIKDVELTLETDEITLTDQYHMSVFAGEIIDPGAWDKPHFETGWCGWVTIDYAINKGRHNHRQHFEVIKQKYEI